MKLYVAENWVKILSLTETERPLIKKFLSKRIREFINGIPTEYTKYFITKDGRFPIGFLDKVIKRFNPTVIDNRDFDRITIHPTSTIPFSLYDYQLDTVEAALKKRNGVLQLPTASGKTRIAIAIACCLDCNTLFLVDETTLSTQTRQTYETLTGKESGFIGATQKGLIVRPEKFTVGKLRSLHIHANNEKIQNYLSTVDCIIIDEVHISASQTTFKTIQSIPALFRYGLSATPKGRSDGLDALIFGCTGPIIYKISVPTLVKKGRIANPIVRFVEYDTTTNKDLESKHSYQYCREYGIIKHKNRNIALLKIAKITPKPIIVFYDVIKHGISLYNAFKKLGYVTEFLSGKDPSYIRNRAKDAIEEEETEVLVVSRIFNKGVDIPKIRSCINASGMKSPIQAIQKLGRGTRIAEGKQEIYYWDFYDSSCRILEKHSVARISTYKAYEIPVEVVTVDELIQISTA